MIYEKIKKTADFLSSQLKNLNPKDAVVLGSGLGGFSSYIRTELSLPYSEIPGFLPPSIDGHQGKLIVGKLKNAHLPIVILQGRIHYYEGHDPNDVVFAIRTLKLLGIERVVLTNASGGINPSFRPGDLMLITDHINLSGVNPLRGPNLSKLGPRFPDMSEPYCKKTQESFKQAAKTLGIELKEGIYAGLSGPTYETPAEVRMLRLLGGDAVGMSTVAESIAANHCGMKVSGIACITNLAAGITSQKLTHKEVIENADLAADNLFKLLEGVL